MDERRFEYSQICLYTCAFLLIFCLKLHPGCHLKALCSDSWCSGLLIHHCWRLDSAIVVTMVIEDIGLSYLSSLGVGGFVYFLLWSRGPVEVVWFMLWF